MLVVPNEGSLYLLRALKDDFNAHQLRLQLYSNNISPTLGNVVGDFSPCTFPGYSSFLLNWPDDPFIDPSSHPVIEAALVNWIVTKDVSPAQRVYGYFVTNGGSTKVIWAERFPSRIIFRCANEALGLRVRFGGLSEFTG